MNCKPYLPKLFIGILYFMFALTIGNGSPKNKILCGTVSMGN